MPGPTRNSVLVIGTGLAGLCAAIEATLKGSRVLLVDAAPTARFGGNARHARNFRVVHEAPLPWIAGHYRASELARELEAAGGHARGPVFEQWAQGSRALVEWLAAQGVRYQDPASRNRRYSRRTAFLLGGGQALVGALGRRLEALGVPVRMGMRVRAMLAHEGPGQPVCMEQANGRYAWEQPGAVVVAAGGCHWDPEWLARAYPYAAGGLLCRGTPHNRGELLALLRERGAEPSGEAGSGHAVVVDARGPEVDGGIVTRLDGLDLGWSWMPRANGYARMSRLPHRHAMPYGGSVSRRAGTLVAGSSLMTQALLACPPHSTHLCVSAAFPNSCTIRGCSSSR